MQSLITCIRSVAADGIITDYHTGAIAQVHTGGILIGNSIVSNYYSSYSTGIVDPIAAVFYIVVRDSSTRVGSRTFIDHCKVDTGTGRS